MNYVPHITDLRHSLKLSQLKAAIIMGVSYSWLTKAEGGHKKPNADRVDTAYSRLMDHSILQYAPVIMAELIVGKHTLQVVELRANYLRVASPLPKVLKSDTRGTLTVTFSNRRQGIEEAIIFPHGFEGDAARFVLA